MWNPARVGKPTATCGLRGDITPTLPLLHSAKSSLAYCYHIFSGRCFTLRLRNSVILERSADQKAAENKRLKLSYYGACDITSDKWSQLNSLNAGNDMLYKSLRSIDCVECNPMYDTEFLWSLWHFNDKDSKLCSSMLTMTLRQDDKFIFQSKPDFL